MAKRRRTLERERCLAKFQKDRERIEIAVRVKRYRSNPQEMAAWIKKINAWNIQKGLMI